MSRKFVLVLSLFVLLSPLLYVKSNSFEVKSSNGGPVHNITTGQNYTTIQEAINDANYGDTILVENGIYNEDVVANQTVSLFGEDRYTTIVNGSGTAPVFKVTSWDVEIINFTIQNNNFLYSAVYVYSYRSGVNVSHNLIRNCSKGAWLWDYSENNFVVKNEILNCEIGVKDSYTSGNFIIGNNISLCSEYGVSVEGSEDSVVQGNTISDCRGGIYLSFGSSQTVISDNDISNCDGGIGLESSSYNNITNNRVEHCKVSGIYLGEALYTGSDNNVVTNNTVSSVKEGDGIFVAYSSGNNLSDNIMLDNRYNFGVNGAEFSDFDNFIDTSNTVDGEPVYYLIGEADVVFDSGTAVGTIYFINCTNVTVEDVTLTNNHCGVFFFNTNSSRIENVTASSNRYGIKHMMSNHNVVVNNDALLSGKEGIWVNKAHSYTLTGNNAFSNIGSGIELWWFYDGLLSDNNATSNCHGIYLDGYNCTLINNFASNNTVESESAAFFLSGANFTVLNNTALNNRRGIYCSGASDSYIWNNTLSYNNAGVQLKWSSNITVTNNTISESGIGVYLHSPKYGSATKNNTIANNTIAYGEVGITLSNAQENIICCNDVTDNDRGVGLSEASNNTFYRNNFIDNTEQVHNYTSGCVNSWNETYHLGGNYWSDYKAQHPDAADVFQGPNQDEPGSDDIWDEPYEIDEENIDYYPIVPEFPSFLILPLFMLATLLATILYGRNHFP